MANPFLVLGGIAIGIVTAGFGILQVPGWLASAQDASAKNDIAQVSIAQAASLSMKGIAQPTITAINAEATGLGVSVTAGTANPQIGRSTDNKQYIVVVKSASGKWFSRLNSGAVQEHAATITTLPLLTTDLTAKHGALPAGLAISVLPG